MPSILLVEDDPLITEIYETKLKESGFDVETLSDGRNVFKRLKEKKFDLLVLDIVLPNLTGFEILRKIRKDKDLKNLKIFVLSNLGQRSDVDLAKELGALKYLIKANFTPSEIVQEIQKILVSKKS